MNLIFHPTVSHWWRFRMILYYQLSSPGEPWVGSFFFPFPQDQECPYSLGVWWGEGLTKTTLRHTNGVLPFSESRAFWDTEGEKNWFIHVYIYDYIHAAAAAKSLQSCPTPCDPINGSPPGSPVPGILQARTLEWVAISFSSAWKWKVEVKLLSRVWL